VVSNIYQKTKYSNRIKQLVKISNKSPNYVIGPFSVIIFTKYCDLW